MTYALYLGNGFFRIFAFFIGGQGMKTEQFYKIKGFDMGFKAFAGYALNIEYKNIKPAFGGYF